MNDNLQNTEQTEEIDLLELLKRIWQKRRMVVKYALFGVLAGLVIGLSLPAEYTSTVKMAPEESNKSMNLGGNISSLASMAGFDLSSMGSGSDGINVAIYPDIISSTPFVTEVAEIPVHSRKIEEPVSLYKYCQKNLREPWWSSALKLPLKVLRLFSPKSKEESVINPYKLTPEQDAVFRAIRQRIGVEIDKKTGVITARATMQDPEVAAIVADSMVSKLQSYIIDYRTNKAKLDYEFTKGLYEESQATYHDRQQRYAAFVDANQHVTRESVKVEQSRLQSEQQLAYTVYSNLAQQLELAKIKVQEQTPSVTVIEPATVPVRKSSTSRLAILIGFTFLGAFIAVVVILFKALFLKREKGITA